MPKTGENIHKRKDGRWEGRFKIGRKANGTIKYASVYGRTYKETKEKLIQAQVDRKTNTQNTKEKLFSEILQLWMENNSLRQKDATKLKYQFIIDKHISPELGTLKMSEINSIVLNNFLIRKRREGRLDSSGGLSSSYLKIIALVLQSAIKFAVEQQYCQPLKTVICKPADERKELPILKKDEQLRLETFLRTHLSLTGLGILLSLNTGLRIGEVCALKWENIDFQNKVLQVRHTISRVKNTNPGISAVSCLILEKPKTKTSMREIPISSVLFPILKEMKSNSISEYVISDKTSFVSPRTFEYRFHRQLELCGIPSINYHALRHTFATRCVEAGVDIKTLSEILGHANVGITLNTYVHSSMDLKREQMEKFVGFTAL